MSATFATIKSIVENAPDYSVDQLLADFGGNSKPSEGYMTRLEAAEYLKIAVKTIDNLRRAGKLPAYKILDLVRFKKADLDKLIKKYTRCSRGGNKSPFST